MSDETQLGSASEENNPQSQEAETIEPTRFAQESFGSFPEPVSNIPLPPGYDNPQFYTRPPASTPSYGYAVPPQGYYGQPPNMFQEQPFLQTEAVAPLPLWTAIKHLPGQYWHVLTHANPATLVAEERKAAWNIVWAQILILCVAYTLFSILIVALEFLLIRAIVPANVDTGPFFTMALPVLAIVLVLACVIITPISFFLYTGFLHLLAKAFGGQGSYLSYCYNYTLVVVPIGILSLACTIIPCIGSLAALAGSVYQIVLLIYMTMGVHRLSGGKASAVVLIPIGVVAALIIGLYIAYFALIFSALPHQ